MPNTAKLLRGRTKSESQASDLTAKLTSGFSRSKKSPLPKNCSLSTFSLFKLMVESHKTVQTDTATKSQAPAPNRPSPLPSNSSKFYFPTFLFHNSYFTAISLKIPTLPTTLPPLTGKEIIYYLILKTPTFSSSNLPTFELFLASHHEETSP